MAVISEVKCGRCDRRYSGFRSRCPYCGARRNKRGKHADETDNAKAKLVIGILLLVILIAAAMVLIISSLSYDDPDDVPADTATASASIEPTYSDDEGVSAVIPSNIPEVSESPSPSVSATVEITAVNIMYNGDIKEDITLRKIGETLQLYVETVPETTDKQAVWASDDEEVFMVVDGKLTAIGAGTANLTLTIDGVSSTCIVRVRGS